MEVHIDEMQSSVRAVDGNSLLAPETLQKIVAVVMKAVEEREAHRDRVKSEQSTNGATED
ncbi:MAG: hypothetical protein JOZ96_19880 [Acidobacteria bacterium]|nr:hypothetical protein [Acidobacteriota bacterium]